MSEVSETIPIVVGIVVSLFIVRWIFNNRNPDTPRGLSREAVEQLSSMFPNVPLAVVRSELVRGGSTQAAIERLLQISANYPVRASLERPYATQGEGCGATQKNTMKAIVQSADLEDDGDTVTLPTKVDAEAWSKDPALREQLLLRKKQQMLQKARRRFLEADTKPDSN